MASPRDQTGGRDSRKRDHDHLLLPHLSTLSNTLPGFDVEGSTESCPVRRQCSYIPSDPANYACFSGERSARPDEGMNGFKRDSLDPDNRGGGSYTMPLAPPHDPIPFANVHEFGNHAGGPVLPPPPFGYPQWMSQNNNLDATGSLNGRETMDHAIQLPLPYDQSLGIGQNIAFNHPNVNGPIDLSHAPISPPLSIIHPPSVGPAVLTHMPVIGSDTQSNSPRVEGVLMDDTTTKASGSIRSDLGSNWWLFISENNCYRGNLALKALRDCLAGGLWPYDLFSSCCKHPKLNPVALLLDVCRRSNPQDCFSWSAFGNHVIVNAGHVNSFRYTATTTVNVAADVVTANKMAQMTALVVSFYVSYWYPECRVLLVRIDCHAFRMAPCRLMPQWKYLNQWEAWMANLTLPVNAYSGRHERPGPTSSIKIVFSDPSMTRSDY